MPRLLPGVAWPQAIQKQDEPRLDDREAKEAKDARRSKSQRGPKVKRLMNPRRGVCPLDDDSATFELAGVVPCVVADPVVGVPASTMAIADNHEGRTRRSAVSKGVRNFRSVARRCANAFHRARAVGHGLKFVFFANRCVVPHADALSDYCGAWVQVWPRPASCFQPWLHAFVITGSTVLCGTGRTDVLVQRSSDGAILLSGYHIRMSFAREEVVATEEQNVQSTPRADDLLIRTGIDGKSCVYRRMSLPASDCLERFQGEWFVSAIEKGKALTLRLRIVGRLWKLEKMFGVSALQIKGGFLTSHEGHVMAGDVRLSWRHDGQGDIALCLEGEQGGKQFVYPCTPRNRTSQR
mmetsp:Transcript_114407/g.323417  ORF Transcript_114407/g.323417 Transcript_114407/m.323417 type:complete len:352 (+) Transcript_114407:73-1128(+)